MASEVNILISVQDAATNQIKNTEHALDSLGRKSITTSSLIKKDQEAAAAFYAKMDAERLAEYNATQKGIAKAARDAAAAQEKAARDAERAQKQQLATVRQLQTALRDIGRTSRNLMISIAGGTLLGGFLGVRGYDFARTSAEAEQMRQSFQRTFGTGAGSVLYNVRNSTKGIVDDMTLMQEAVKTNIEGIDANKLPQLFKLGAAASQRLGISAAEGINLVRRASVELDESALKELGIVQKRDGAYQTYLAILNKSTKGLGQYAKIQFQVNYALAEMSKRFGANYGVMENNLQGFQLLESAALNLKRTIGGLLDSAFGPMARNLGNWLSGLYEMLSSFDARTGKGVISTGLSNILGPQTVETLREIAAGILDIIDFTKGFISGIGSAIKMILEFVGKFVDISDAAGFNWVKIGKAVGFIATSIVAMITPMGILASIILGIAATFATMTTSLSVIKWLLGGMKGNLLRSILGEAIGLGTGAAVGGGAAATATTAGVAGGAGVIASSITAGFEALTALVSSVAVPATAAAGAAAATYMNTESAVDRIYQASGGGKFSPSFFSPPSFAPTTSAGDAKNPQDTKLLSQAVSHLSNINDKLQKQNTFEQKILGDKN
jgi:hypothetical protein